MKKLLEIALKTADSAEIYKLDTINHSVSFENSRLMEMESSFQSGVSLRLLKNGRQGFAFTKNLRDRLCLVKNALVSLSGAVEAPFELPRTAKLPRLSTFDKSISMVTTAELAAECDRVSKLLDSKTKAQANVAGILITTRLSILNSSGTDLKQKHSTYVLVPAVLFPGTCTSISRISAKKTFKPADGSLLDFITGTYNSAREEVVPASGKMKVMFMPEVMYALFWRIKAGVSGESLYRKTTPLAGKIGQKIFSDRITIYNDPLDDSEPGARSFDDEGTACRKYPIVEKGVFRNFYFDLLHAGKMKVPPTGNGFRSAMWGGDRVTMKPGSALTHPRFKTGSKSFSEMVESMDEGIIVAHALGAHSGNIPNGDLSIGLSPGLYVKDGKIRGHVKDAMVTGNIYEMFNNVLEIENELHDGDPAILFDQVSVATRKK
ncbi:MAG: metallopeptidase TldD-related protein [Candidatus Wallbacteria bacterium]|nr:metallopeptidase TldD-related protein [Candidatus Wallbacteria bacterium]